MASQIALPRWPALLFGIIEPILLFIGCYDALSDPQGWQDKQVPSRPTTLFQRSQPITASSKIIILQTSNIYLLLGLLGIVCSLFSTPRVARLYLLCVAVADLGHIASVYAGLGSQMFFDVGNWNDMIWGHVGVSAFLFVNRISTAAGVFGQVLDDDRQSLERKKA